MTLGDEDLGNLRPLLTSRINTSRVVSAGVEEEDGLSRRRTEEVEESGEIETNGLGVVVGVINGSASDAVEDRLVVGCRK